MGHFEKVILKKIRYMFVIIEFFLYCVHLNMGTSEIYNVPTVGNIYYI
jgi:hypothetical protein